MPDGELSPAARLELAVQKEIEANGRPGLDEMLALIEKEAGKINGFEIRAMDLNWRVQPAAESVQKIITLEALAAFLRLCAGNKEAVRRALASKR